MIVIIDTSIIVSDFFMNSVKFKILFDYAKRIPIKIYIPEVVYDELKNKYRELFESQFQVYEKSISKLRPLLENRNVDFLSFDIDLQIEFYSDFLDDLIKNKKIELLPYPKTTHKDIVKHELSRKKPFKSNGSGYRDKLIIDSILEKLPLPGEEVIFISNNSNDFGEEPNLCDDLFFFNNNVANRSRFSIRNTLSSFIEKYINPIKQINENIKTIPQLNKIAGLDISEWILANLKDIVYDNAMGYAIVGLEESYGTILLHKIDIINEITLSDVFFMEDNTIACKIFIDAKLVLYISGDQDDFVHSESWSNFFEYNPGDGRVDISTWQSFDTRMMISVVIEPDNKFIISYEPTWVDGESGRTFYRW